MQQEGARRGRRFREPHPRESQHGEDGPPLDHDHEGVHGPLDFGVLVESEHPLGEDQVPGGTDREVFGDALYEPEHDCIQDCHGRVRILPGGGVDRSLSTRNALAFGIPAV